jgi:hypothetical protein
MAKADLMPGAGLVAIAGAVGGVSFMAQFFLENRLPMVSFIMLN